MLIKANWQESLARNDQRRGGPKHLESLNEWTLLHRAMEKLRLLCPEFSQNSKSRLTEPSKHLVLSVQKLRKVGHRHPGGFKTTEWERAGGRRSRPGRPAARWRRSWVRRVKSVG